MGKKETPEWIKKLTKDKDKKKKSGSESDWMDQEKMDEVEKSRDKKDKSRWSKVKDWF